MIRLFPRNFYFLCFLSGMALAQELPKTDFSLARKIKNSKTSNAKKEEIVKILVKGDIPAIGLIASSNGGKIHYSAGDIASVTIPLDKIFLLLQSPAVKRVEMGAGKPSQPLNDTAAVKNNTAEINSGQAPLPQAYDGTGIVIGFMDTGIDFTHPDFKDAQGKSRISYLWDQNKPVAGNTPQPYGYGQEWTNTDIDAGQASAHNDLAYFGHGTHDAGIAAGNGLAVGNYKGVAPNADIIMVAMDLNYINNQPNADAVNYIFSKAKAMGKPCVINASVGNYFGSHDGKDLEAQIIDTLIREQPGRAMVASAGNLGNDSIHLKYDVSPDSSFTWMAGNSIYLEVWGDTADFKNIQFAIGADKVTPSCSFRGQLPFSAIGDHLGLDKTDTLKNNGNRIGLIRSYGDYYAGSYSMLFLITPDSTAYNWRFSTKGSGKFDAWSYNFVSGGLPPVGAFPDIARYKLPDGDQNMVSSFQCLSSVITVGNYYNKRSYYTHTNGLYTDPLAVPYDIAPNSSRGPTRDGRIKPDIAATGSNMISCGVLSLMPSWISAKPNEVGQGGKHIASGGTSTASPVVAGIAALYLQKNPGADYRQVKDAILGTALQDAFTGGSLPDNTWGYGKVNGFGALTGFGTLSTSTVSAATLCAGTTMSVSYTGANANNTGNTISVELSGSSGSFSAPVTIGSGSGSNAGSISCTIPVTIASGSGYRVRVVSSNPAVTGTDNGNNITVYSLPGVTVSGNLSSCSGSTVLTASPAGHYYLWSTGETTPTISLSSPGTYSVNVTDNNNCSNSYTVSVNIHVTPTLTVSGNLSICKGESSVITVAGSGLSAGQAGTYRWTPLTSLTAFTSDSSVVELNPGTTTSYSISTSLNGCDTLITIELVVDPCLKVNEISYEEPVNIYPNPFSEEFTIYLYPLGYNLQFAIYDLEIYNTLGEKILADQIFNRTPYTVHPNLPDGIYFYRIFLHKRMIAEGKLVSIND